MRTVLRFLTAATAAWLAMAGVAQALTVYSSVDEENAKKLLDAFTKATGVETQMVFLSSGPALSRIEAEKANPQADVWFGGPATVFARGAAEGLLEAHRPPWARP